MIDRDNVTVEYIPELDREQQGARRAEFLRYYYYKRIHHQIK